MKKKNSSKILGMVLRRTHFYETLAVYLLVFFALSFAIYRIEDVFDSYGKAMWYCFELVTTVGFGETVAVTRAGRVLSMVLSVYSIGMIAIITSTVVTYHQVKVRTRQDDIISMFMDKLERLPELDRDELADISERIRKMRM